MADLDTDSTDSDNNNLVPLINEYFGMPLVVPQFQHAESPEREIDNSSESDIDNQFHIIGSLSSSVSILIYIQFYVILTCVLFNFIKHF